MFTKTGIPHPLHEWRGGMDISRWEMWNIGEGEWTSPVGRCGILAPGEWTSPVGRCGILAWGNGHLPLGDVEYWHRGNGHLPLGDVDNWSRGLLAETPNGVYRCLRGYESHFMNDSTSSIFIVFCSPVVMFLTVTAFCASSSSPKTATKVAFRSLAYLNCLASLSNPG